MNRAVFDAWSHAKLNAERMERIGGAIARYSVLLCQLLCIVCSRVCRILALSGIVCGTVSCSSGLSWCLALLPLLVSCMLSVLIVPISIISMPIHRLRTRPRDMPYAITEFWGVGGMI